MSPTALIPTALIPTALIPTALIPTVWSVAALVGVTAILVGPGPAWVRRWGFLYRVPRPAVVLWQAGTVAALVAVIGAGALCAGLLWAGSVWAGSVGAGVPAGGGGRRILGLTGGLVVVVFAVVVLVRLGWALTTVIAATRVRRKRHRAAVDLLGRLDDSASGVADEVRIVDYDLPVAYCLPGLRKSRVVLSEGALRRLAPDELRAVLAHERAHVRARHDLVLDTFAALHRAFPHLVRSATPWQESKLLVEMLADDAAIEQVGSVALSRALVALAGAPVPPTAIGAADFATLARVHRLADPATDRRGLSVAVYLLAAGLVALPVTLLVAAA